MEKRAKVSMDDVEPHRLLPVSVTAEELANAILRRSESNLMRTETMTVGTTNECRTSSKALVRQLTFLGSDSLRIRHWLIVMQEGVAISRQEPKSGFVTMFRQEEFLSFEF